MQSQNLQPYEFPMTKNLLTNVKNAQSRYFQVLDERRHTKNRSEKAEKLAIFDADIDKINKEILFQSTMKDLRAESDKAMIVAEKQTSLGEIKSIISKCNALKRAADEKALELDKAIAKKESVFIKERAIVALITLLNSFSCFVKILQFCSVLELFMFYPKLNTGFVSFCSFHPLLKLLEVFLKYTSNIIFLKYNFGLGELSDGIK